jgi:hypothetical protein
MNNHKLGYYWYQYLNNNKLNLLYLYKNIIILLKLFCFKIYVRASYFISK